MASEAPVAAPKSACPEGGAAAFAASAFISTTMSRGPLFLESAVAADDLGINVGVGNDSTGDKFGKLYSIECPLAHVAGKRMMSMPVGEHAPARCKPVREEMRLKKP